MKKLIIVLVLALVGKVGMAEESGDVEASRSRPLVELGVNLGTPAGLNLSTGIWGTSEVPLVFRVSGMYYGSRLKGVQGDLGYLFNPEGNFKHYVAVSGTTLAGETSTDRFNWTGIGPTYGLNYHGFSTQVGLSFGKSSAASLTKFSSPQLQFQIGYSFLF